MKLKLVAVISVLAELSGERLNQSRPAPPHYDKLELHFRLAG
jgi:hypothetical protein